MSKELSALSQMRHANVVQFFGVAFLDSFPGGREHCVAVVTELCEKGDLRRWIDEGGHRLDEKLCAMIQVARGMAYLHRDCEVC